MRLHPFPARPLPDTLLAWQRDAIHSVHAHLAEGAKRVLGVAATGMGKGTLIPNVARALDARTLVLAHREELIDQLAATFGRWWPETSIGKVMAHHHDSDANVVVATVQTLGGRLARVPGPFDLIVVDEAHHIMAPTYQSILDHYCGTPDLLGELPASAPVVLGVTATPDRADRKGVAEWFGHRIAFSYDTRWAIDHGYLCDLRTLTLQLDALNLDDVEMRRGDYADGALGRALQSAGAPGLIVQAWQQHGEDRQTMVFSPTVAMSQSVADTFADAGIAAEHMDGAARKDDRRAVLERFRAGQTRVLCNVALYTEGVDVPETSCVIVARPTRSRPLLSQIIGRGLRLAPGKADCIAEGSLVLTDVGLIRIENVDTTMRVWDGEEFVAHDGAVCRGTQEVIEYAGLIATRDHKVWSDGQWRTFEDCARDLLPIAVTGDGGRAVREAEGRRRSAGEDQGPLLDPGRMRRMRRRRGEVAVGVARRHRRLQGVRQPAVGRPAVVGEPVHRGQAAMHEPQERRLREIWSAGDRVSVQRANGDGGMDRRTSRRAPGHGDRPHRQQWTLRGRQPEVGDWRPQSRQQPQGEGVLGVPSVQDRAPRGPLRRRHATATPPGGADVGANRRAVPHVLVQTERRVWDVLNAGPRNRFTAQGLLVSNCVVIDLSGATKDNKLVQAHDLLGLHRALERHESAKQAMQREAEEAVDAEERAAARKAEQDELDWQHGTARFANVDAFGRPAGMRHRWVHAPATGCVDRWVHDTGDWRVVFRRGPDAARTWVAGAFQPKDATVAPVHICESTSFVAATEAAEQWIDGNRAAGAWKADAPTPAQLHALRRAGWTGDPAKLTKARAGALIGKHKAAEKQRDRDVRQDNADAAQITVPRVHAAIGRRAMVSAEDVPSMLGLPATPLALDTARRTLAAMEAKGMLRTQGTAYVVIHHAEVSA